MPTINSSGRLNKSEGQSEVHLSAFKRSTLNSIPRTVWPCILWTGMLCMSSMPAAAVEPWIAVERNAFTNDPIKSRGQGVTTDGTNWYFSGTNALELTDGTFASKLLVSPAIADPLANPSPIAPKGLNHIGDIDYADGLLYISLDSSKRDPITGKKYNTPVFAIYRASDMTFTGQAFSLNPPHGVQDIASWVAVDAKNGVGYGMAYDNANEIAVYNLQDWTFQKYIPLSQAIDQAQGGKVLDGWIYFSTENATKSIYRANLQTGEVEELGRLVVPGEQEVQGLTFRNTAEGWSMYVLNREEPASGSGDVVAFYRYLRPYGNTLSGEIHASLKGTFIDDSRYVRDSASQRIRSAFDTVGATPLPVMSYDGNDVYKAPATADGLVLWSEALATTTSADGAGYAAGLNHTTGGFLAGADASFGTWRLGALAGYSHTSLDIATRASSGSSDNFHLGVYGGSQWGALGFRTGAIYGWHSIETTRHVVFPAFSETLSANYDASTAQAFGELGYRIDVDRAAFEPFVNLAYVHLGTDAFAETGGTTAALASARSTSDNTFTTLGIRGSTDLEFAAARATVRGMLGWQHAYGEVTPSSSFAFTNGSAFTISGAPIAREALAIEAGVDLYMSSKVALGASYSGQIADNAQAHSLKVNFDMKF